MTEYKDYPYSTAQGNAGQLEIQLQAAQARIVELERELEWWKGPCLCCRDHGCLDGCQCKPEGER